MAKTNAEHQAATRARRSARIKRMEAALEAIATLCKPGMLRWEGVDIGNLARQALSPPPNERES